MSKKLFQRSLLASTVIAGMAFASPAFAQDPAVEASTQDTTPATQETPADTPAATDAADADDSTIVVTGSRIVSPNIVSLAPVQVVGEAEIDQSGAINLQEVLLENPAFGTPGLSTTNSAFLTSGAGVATVDLRDLGADRTLVLINSRRVVAGLPGSATVDLNTIPTQFIDRVDILTGGASSLYGSDAVAGVVNIIYKRNFEGLLMEGQYGITQRGDNARYQVSGTLGANFADDRGNVMIHVGYSDEKGLLSRQRKNTRVDDIDKFLFYGDPDDYGVSYAPYFSSFTPQGRFVVGGQIFTFDPDNNLQPCFTTNGASCGGGAGVGPNGFNRQFFRTLSTPVKRWLFAERGHFDITDNISFITEATYSKTQASTEIEPFPLDSNQITPTGVIPIETFVGGIAVRNPLVPDDIFNAATDTDGDGLRDMLFRRRLSEVGTRNASADRHLFRFVTGFEGKLFDDKFSWDVTYNFGRMEERQRNNGQVNVQNFRNALAGIPDTADVDDDGDTTEVVCADPVAVDQGCVPINIFGFDSISPEAFNYVAAQGDHSFKVTQQVWAANLSGSLFELPAGPLGVAVGAEYRKEQSEEDWDSLTNAGLNAGNALPDTFGKFNVKELYGEINVPVLKDQPFANQLNLRAAGRLSDYSTVGNVSTYSLGADYAPIEDIRFRATYARAVRAPNIGELFTGPSQTFPTGLVDPCEGLTAADAGTVLSDQCLAFPGVAINMAANGGEFTLSQPDKQGISGFNIGNPDLDVETAKTFTAGVVINPRSIPALRNLVLSVDYFNIEIDDAIISPGRTTILDQCFNEGNDDFCQFVTRFPVQTGGSSPGALEFINSISINSAVLKTAGIDTVLQYRTGLDRFMDGLDLNARVAWTHLLKGYVIEIPGIQKDDFAGEIGTAKDRVNGSVNFATNKWAWNLTGTYIGKSYEDDITLESNFGLDDHAVSVDAEFYLDTQITFTPTKNYEFFVGADNVLDNKAPNILMGSPFNVTGADTAADVYDIFGRRFYAGARLRF